MQRRDVQVPRGRRENGRLCVGGMIHPIEADALLRFVRLPPFAEPPHDVIEDRRKKDSEQRHADHAAEDGHPQRLAHLGAGAVGEEQRDDPQDKRHRRHHDRPQP